MKTPKTLKHRKKTQIESQLTNSSLALSLLQESLTAYFVAKEKGILNRTQKAFMRSFSDTVLKAERVLSSEWNESFYSSILVMRASVHRIYKMAKKNNYTTSAIKEQLIDCIDFDSTDPILFKKIAKWAYIFSFSEFKSLPKIDFANEADRAVEDLLRRVWSNKKFSIRVIREKKNS